jgi:hypothetical protein
MEDLIRYICQKLIVQPLQTRGKQEHHKRYAFFLTRNPAMTCDGASQFFLYPVMCFGDALKRHAVSAGKHDNLSSY